MSKEQSGDTGGLSPLYQTYEHQKCFIAYTEQAAWSADLLSACQAVLSRPEFNLEPDYARKHFYPDVPLRQKALELIANARYGIYDLSFWQSNEGEWHMPQNVFIELGIAIALNRPMLLLRHASNRELELPNCLKSASGHILEFSGETTLKQALEKSLSQWVTVPPERDWWNRYCIFGGRMCEYREAHPCARQWGREMLHCHISDGPDVDRLDFRAVVEDVLGRFSDVTFDYLDALPLSGDYDFLLCAYCQNVRSTPFAIYRITPQTPAEAYVAIGMSIALEAQFEYRILKMLMVGKIQHVPSLLSGYEVVVACSDKERKSHLQAFVPTVVQKVRETVWKPSPLPFLGDVFTPESIDLVNTDDLRAKQVLQLVQQGIKLAQRREYESALDFLWQAVELDPTCAQAYQLIGQVLTDLDRSQEAEVYFQRAIELEPTNSIDELVRQLKSIPRLVLLDDAVLADLATVVGEEWYEAGHAICTQGERGDRLYAIALGQVVVKSVEGGREITVTQLLEGDIFGERALVEDLPRTATIVAETRVRLLSLHRADYQQLLLKHPNLKRILVGPEVIPLLGQVPLFSRFSRGELTALAQHVGVVFYVPEREVVKQGDMGTTMYVVLKGGLVAYQLDSRGRNRPVKALEEGDAFGETSLLVGEPRDATVMTKTYTELCYIHKASFGKFLTDYPGVQNKLRPRSEVERKWKATRGKQRRQ